MEMPLVSIIVPVYNAQSHLSRCLESICGQEYKNLELIVINDGSKDKSLTRLRGVPQKGQPHPAGGQGKLRRVRHPESRPEACRR